jgi:large subunit ribosomal protein L5
MAAQQKGKGGAAKGGKSTSAKGGKGGASRRPPAPVSAPSRGGRDTSGIGAAALRGVTARPAADGNGAAPGERVTPRLKERYASEIGPRLREEFGYRNVMQVPGLTKIIVNMGVGEAARDAKLIDGAVRDLAVITGQKPAVTRARKSIAQFKLREGMPIGAHVTLRGDRMWEFCDRLLSLALPRIRDFRGLSDRQFDGRGNYTFGLTEQLMFHEINPDQADRQRGMDITVVTTATNDAEGRSLLRRLGFPFRES